MGKIIMLDAMIEGDVKTSKQNCFTKFTLIIRKLKFSLN